MSAVNRSLRSASKQLRLQPTRVLPCAAAIRSASVGALRIAGSLPASRNTFSTSAARLSGAPNMTSGAREYDPEIKDIADFVANKPIDSELAVSTPAGRLLHLGKNRFTPPSPRSVSHRGVFGSREAPMPFDTIELYTDPPHSSTLLDGFSSTPSAAVLRASASRSAPSSWVPLSPAPSFPTVPRFPAPPLSSTPSTVPSTLAP